MNPALRALRPYPMAELQERKAALQAAGVPLYDFGTGDPIEPTAPAIRQALIAALPEVSQYPSVRGPADFRQAVSAYLQRRFDVAIDGAAVLPSAGSKEAIFHLPLARIDPASGKDGVLYGTPGYPVYEAGTLFAHGRPQPVTLTAEAGFRLELTEVPTAVLERTAICWLNYPHNPTGACVDLEYYRRQWQICRAHDILLASDECYVDLWFDESAPPPVSLLQVAHEGVLVFGSCSKRSGMTGYRSGFITGDAERVADYRRWRAAMGVGSPTFITAAATAAWRDDAHVAERRQAFAAKRRLLADGLTAKGLTILPSDAGLYIWARLPQDFQGDADTYAARCLERGIVISPGGFFGPGGEGWIRLALVPTLADCQAALERWP